MKDSVINQLNQLNLDFYDQVAASFDETRQQAWEGWQEIPAVLTKHLDSRQLSVIDLGCGNGRLAEFLAKALPRTKFEYWGVDTSQQLLQKAEPRLKSLEHVSPFHLIHSDLLQLDSLSTKLPSQVNIISLFGVMHHMPSFELRKKLIEWCWFRLSDDGILLLSFWHFTQSKQFKRHLSTEQIMALNIPIHELEPNDYFLDWQREVKAVRFCHLIDDKEEQQLIDPTKWEYLKNFSADTSNYYLFLQKR